MIFNLSEAFQAGYFYIIFLVIIMLVAGYAKEFNITPRLYNCLLKKIKHPKILLTVLSTIGGVLPIPGRIIASAGLLDACIPKAGWRKDFGILNYLATHHYYLWSPLEKTILIPMAILGVGYFGILSYTWPLLVIAFGMLFGFIWFMPIEIKDLKPVKIYYHRKNLNPCKMIKWKTLFLVWAVIITGSLIKQNATELLTLLEHYSHIGIVACLAFVLSFLMGSSGKFTGIVASLTAIYGIEYFMFFFAIEFAGYLISPIHKCNIITLSYFETPIKKYMGVISLWALLNIIYGVTTIL